MPLVDRLKSISIDHGESLRVLNAFVQQTRSSIGKSASILEEKLGAMTDVPVGEDIQIKAEDGDESITLTKGQYDILRNILTYNHNLTSKFPNVLYEMSFIYRVALHDALVPDILTEILCASPTMLKSKKSMTHDEIIDNMDAAKSLFVSMAQKELNSEMNNEPIKAQLEYIQNKFGMQLVKKPEHLDQLLELSARRNLLVHSHGRVDAKYKRLVPSSVTKEGDRITVDYAYYEKSERLLTAIAEVLFTLTSTIHAKLQDPITIESGFPTISEIMSGGKKGRTEI